jgi:hypothetical protein
MVKNSYVFEFFNLHGDIPMRKLITLIAAATLAASPFAFAEEQAGNPNDVLQAVPGQSENNMTVADAAAPAAAATDSSAAMTPAAGDEKPAMKTHHKKHHMKKHHHKKHHAKKMDTKESTTEPATAPTETPAAPAAAETPAQ